jgi:hypothetical protein
VLERRLAAARAGGDPVATGDGPGSS